MANTPYPSDVIKLFDCCPVAFLDPSIKKYSTNPLTPASTSSAFI